MAYVQRKLVSLGTADTNPETKPLHGGHICCRAASRARRCIGTVRTCRFLLRVV